jgi:hypothetical protein
MLSKDGLVNVNLDSIDRLTIRDRIFCAECGIPKIKESFDEGSVICKTCIPIAANRLRLAESIAADKNRGTFSDTIEKLRRESSPYVPGGVQKMNEKLKGKSVYEYVAETFLELRGDHLFESERKSIPRDFRAEVNLLKLMHEANKAHDDALTEKSTVVAGLPQGELESIMIETAVEQMAINRELRMKIFRALYQRIPDFIAEILESAGHETLEVAAT